MQRGEKIDHARRYCCELVAAHAAISGLALGGSVATGNDLPISDLDLWCFVDQAAPDLPIDKHYAKGVYVDISQYPASLLRATDALADPYFSGYLRDAMILFDRRGDLARCQVLAREHLSSVSFRRKQLASLRESIERNCGEFARSIETSDANEICRSSIFAAWSLCDHMLTDHGIPPGGGRGLARLRTASPPGHEALVEFEGASHLASCMHTELVETCVRVSEQSSFFQMWIDKVRWMFANGHVPDAFHALWIALGLRIKEAKTRRDERLRSQLTSASQRWLDIVGWDQPTAKGKLCSLRQIIDEYCHPVSPE